VRLSLEELALRKAVEKNPEQTVSEMGAALEASKKIVANGDFQGFFNTDFLFHEIMYRRSGNPWIEDILSDLHLVINLIRTSPKRALEDVAAGASRTRADHGRPAEGAVGRRCGRPAAALNNHRRVRRNTAFLEESLAHPDLRHARLSA
jgi:DNA-binding GntR family transcriptional regulator